MRHVLKSEIFKITYDHSFKDIINACAQIKRNDQDGTWITNDMQNAYQDLHELGVAHSVEVWKNDELVGGLYGVIVGNTFCGESMFSKVSNASKAALIWLCRNMSFKMIDCQFHTPHLESMGAEFISRKEYITILQDKSAA